MVDSYSSHLRNDGKFQHIFCIQYEHLLTHQGRNLYFLWFSWEVRQLFLQALGVQICWIFVLYLFIVVFEFSVLFNGVQVLDEKLYFTLFLNKFFWLSNFFHCASQFIKTLTSKNCFAQCCSNVNFKDKLDFFLQKVETHAQLACSVYFTWIRLKITV